MSEERNESGNQPTPETTETVKAAAPDAPVNASPETAAKAPADAPVAAAEPEVAPVVIPAGTIGLTLDAANLGVKHLGEDNSGIEMLGLDADNALSVSLFLRDNQKFDLLLSCTGIDWKDRLESIYHLYSTINHNYLTLRITAVNEHSPSLVSVWHAADWHEREAYDLLGIQYDGHPNMVRILMPDDWLGHPLRKDYKMNDPRLVWNER
jgi:NADH-quinone oxidoreductase subunit C